jgi:gamma-glutamylaminecyclotransferase
MKVAVYGTLKRGFGNHHFLRDAKFIENDWVMIDAVASCGFPMARISEDSKNFLQCEVYSISDEILLNLDQLEGEGFLYKRVKTKTRKGNNVWVYHILQSIHSMSDVDLVGQNKQDEFFYAWPEMKSSYPATGYYNTLEFMLELEQDLKDDL